MDRRLQLAVEQGYIYYLAYEQEQVSYGYGYHVLVDAYKVYLVHPEQGIEQVFTLEEFGKTWGLTQGSLTTVKN